MCNRLQHRRTESWRSPLVFSRRDLAGYLQPLRSSPPEQFSEAIEFAPISPGCVECHYVRVG